MSHDELGAASSVIKESRRFGFFKVGESAELNASDAVLGDIDVLITVASWERRCLALLDAGRFSANYTMVYKFEPRNGDNNRTKHASEIAKFAATRSERVFTRKLDLSNYFEDNFKLIFEDIAMCRRECGRQLVIGIDISGIPKTYFLAIIASCMSTGLAHTVRIFYGVADYKKEDEDSARHLLARGPFSFTEGSWRPVQIPYLEGNLSVALPREILVSMGAEGGSVEKFVKRYEPDEIALVSPVPGATKEISDNARREAQSVRRNIGVADEKYAEVAAFDTVGMAATVLRFAEAAEGIKDFSAMALGSKPHALGLGVAGLANTALCVVGRVPTSYLEIDREGNGKAYYYEINDISAPGLSRIR